MSGIYGLVRLDGSPVGSDELATMREPMAYWGPDGGGEWIGDGAAFGQLVRRQTPQARHERGPVRLEGGTIVTAAGRLDNRDELLRALRVPPPERAVMPDGRLIALAYAEWNEEAPRRLLGDWALAAYDPHQRRLVLARDHYGQTGLYHWSDGSTLAFASSLKGILALPGVPRRLNELRLARDLVVWPAEGATTLYDGIFRLPPAHMLTFDRFSLRTREFWRVEDAPPVRLPSDGDYVERFLELFTEAVGARLPPDGSVAATLSAGLDSAAVTALAAKELSREGRRITALTAVPAYPQVRVAARGRFADEWPGASSVARLHPNVDHVAERATAITPLQAMERSFWVRAEPEFGAGNLHWMIALLERCRSHGDVLLTGQCGNGGVSWVGPARGRIRGLRGRARPLLARARRAARRNPSSTPIHPDFARRLDIDERMREAGFDPAAIGRTPHERRLATLLPGITPVGAIWHQYGAAYGLDVRDPTADVRLLEFCFGVPDDQFGRDGQDRWLMRRGLEGLVPPAVQWSRERGLQGADLARRLRSDDAAVTETVERLAASATVSAYLDMPSLRRMWGRIRVSAGSDEPAGAFGFARGVLMGRFLLRFEG